MVLPWVVHLGGDLDEDAKISSSVDGRSMIQRFGPVIKLLPSRRTRRG